MPAEKAQAPALAASASVPSLASRKADVANIQVPLRQARGLAAVPPELLTPTRARPAQLSPPSTPSNEPKLRAISPPQALNAAGGLKLPQAVGARDVSSAPQRMTLPIATRNANTARGMLAASAGDRITQPAALQDTVAAQTSAPGSTLRSRRLSTGSRALTVDTNTSVGLKRIRKVESVSELYSVGKVVMPSCHHDMEVRFARKVINGKRSGQESVVKIRRKPGSFANPQEEQQWRQNTELMMNLPECPGIARIDEVLEDASGYYVVMEKVDGMDLHETLHASGPLPVEDVKEVMRQLLSGVAEMHANGCIHKDLKLENVMVDRTNSSTTPSSAGSPTVNRIPGSVKLIDFDTVEDWSPKSPKATRVLGTDQYISPEAYEGKYSPASDVFALGVIAYRLLIGSFPFKDGIFDDKPGENWVGSPKMKEIKGRLTNVRLDLQRPAVMALPAADRVHAQRLLSRMLAVNELHRPTAAEALQDPWLQPPAERRRASMPAKLRDSTDSPKVTLSSSCREMVAATAARVARWNLGPGTAVE